MGSIKVKIRIEFNRFDELRGRMRQRAGQIVRKTAFDVQRDYQLNARRDTGAQVNSAYVVTANSSTYAQAMAAVQAANPGTQMLPEVARPNPYSAIVAVGAVYGLINEYGGETGPDGTQRRSGDGAMTQAAASNRAPFRAALTKLLDS